MLRVSRVQGPRGRIVASTLARHPVYAQELLEGSPEVAVEIGIDERIETRVEVANPEEHGADYRRVRARVAAHGGDDVPEEERQEAEDEGSHDDAQRLRGLVLPLHPLPLRPLHVPVARQHTVRLRRVTVVVAAEAGLGILHVHGAGLHELLLLPGLDEDLGVDEDHDGAGDPEADAG